MKKLICLLSFLLVFQITIAQNHKKTTKELDRYIENARQQWKVPGLAVAVVKDGKILLSKGYGVCKQGSSNKVNAQTIFSMASTTKAFTAAAMGMLVDEGKVSWDDKVIDHYPAFRLQDAYVTANLRIRDLFTHNSGLGNMDLPWALWEDPGATILSKMQHQSLSYGFRGGYTYQNLMYLVAGEVIHQVSGQTWDDFVQKRIFDPLGMTRSFTNQELSLLYTNRSTPHFEYEDNIHIIEDDNADMIAPAGAGWSCVEDMSKWMQFLLDSARVDGKRLLQLKTFKELFVPHTIVPKTDFYPTNRLTRPNWTTYALGWFQHDYQGRFVNFHTGSLAGTVAIIGLIPEENLGVYVLGNLDHAEVRHAIMYKVFDLFGKEKTDRDWSSEFLKLYTDIKARQKKLIEKGKAKRVLNTQPGLPLKKYTGKYLAPNMGMIEVVLENGQLMAKAGKYHTFQMTHWHFETYSYKVEKWPWVEGLYLQFQLNSLGEVSGLSTFGTDFKKVK